MNREMWNFKYIQDNYELEWRGLTYWMFKETYCNSSVEFKHL